MSDHYIVTAPSGGTRRAGRYWPQGASIVAADDLDDATLLAIQADPRMDAVYVGAEPEPAPGPVSDAAISSSVADLICDLADVIKELPADAYTKGGLPDLRALSALCARQVTAAERDAAWSLLTKMGFAAPLPA